MSEVLGVMVEMGKVGESKDVSRGVRVWYYWVSMGMMRMMRMVGR